jgi:hypothetical protein
MELGEKKYERMPSDVSCLPARMPKGKFLSTHGGEPMSSKPQFQLAASLPLVSEAPGRGILPGVSRYTAALPVLCQLDAQPIEQVGPLIQRKMLHGSHSTFVKWIVKAGGVFALRHHSSEQITWITERRCDVY